MQILMAMSFVMLSLSFPVAGATTGPSGETPTAADLLRAEHRAREAAERLQMPPRPAVQRWKRGGDGWLRSLEVEAPEPAAGPPGAPSATHAVP
jgi:hypothetical protein